MVWQFSKNTGPNSGDFTLAIEKAEAIRDNKDLPVVTVDLLADFQSDAAAAALSVLPQAQCVMLQVQTTNDRTFTGTAVPIPAGPGTSRYSRVKATILPGEEGKAIQGEFKLACAMIRDQSTLYTTSTVKVNVPPPRFAESILTGDYANTLDPTAGTCDYETPSMHVEETGPSAVTFSFPEVLPGSQFPVTLTADLSFQFDAASLGTFKGKFRLNDVDLTLIEGTVDRAPCAFKWNATRRPPAPTN